MYHTIQKAIAAWAFNHYIAYYYFDNVNVSQLKVAFEKGEVELENLPIKKSALQHFDLPLEVESGIVGKLSIKVPLLSLLTDPWIIKINDLMLTLSPGKASNNLNSSLTSQTELNATINGDENIATNLTDKSHIDFLNDAGDNLADYLQPNNSNEVDSESKTTSEGAKYAEFYSSFSETVSKVVKDIYKNIRLEVQSLTVLFEDFDYGLHKLSIDNLLLHRPKSVRNLMINDISLHLSCVGLPFDDDRDLICVKIEECQIDIFDEVCNNTQICSVKDKLPKLRSQSSETHLEGCLKNVCISQSPNNTGPLVLTRNKSPSSKKRDIFNCDALQFEFKLNDNLEGVTESAEKNVYMKLDLSGMQYLYSIYSYEILAQKFKTLLNFVSKLKRQKDELIIQKSGSSSSSHYEADKPRGWSYNKLIIVNIEDGLVYLLDDTCTPCAIPLLEVSLEDCRIWQFSDKTQRNGFLFAKVGCNYYDRETSIWDILLKPWPLNLSWDLKLGDQKGDHYSTRHHQIAINSDECANFLLTSAFLDIYDISLKRVIDQFFKPRTWRINLNPSLSAARVPARELDSVFIITNETGYKLYFAPLESNSDVSEILESSSIITQDGDINNIKQLIFHKSPTFSGSSASNRDSPDLNYAGKWIKVDVGETASFKYDMSPIYRRHISDIMSRSREIAVRVEGWKTLAPIATDKTGTFYREACSDRVMNEDTHIVITIELEKNSARKIISIRSPLNLINKLNETLEVHFVESNQALYLKPESHLSVPLPYISNKIHIRPCNVGVTISERTLLWDKIQKIFDSHSEIHNCNPITVTNIKHASYCTSKPYRICVSTKRLFQSINDDNSIDSESLEEKNLVPIYEISFLPPLEILNLLLFKVGYSIESLSGNIPSGAQQKVHHIDTTKPMDIHFTMNGFPQSKAINISPGATGSFHHTLEMVDKRNRSLYLNAKIILASIGETPALQVVIFAPYWFINKTKLPLVFKQEGAALEAAGQFRDSEDAPCSPFMFSFYESELEPPWLCCMRLGCAKGISNWCDGFKLEKGSGERRLLALPGVNSEEKRTFKALVDINIRKGSELFAETLIVTFTTRYGFDPFNAKTPKKASLPSPQNYKLSSYNHKANLAERIADQAISLFGNRQRNTSDISLTAPGFSLTLANNSQEQLIEASASNLVIKCTTKTKEQIIDCSIQNIKVVNMLADCEKEIVLDRASDFEGSSLTEIPALRIIIDRVLANSFGMTFFKQVQFSICDLILNIEEKLVLKIVEFIGKRAHRANSSSEKTSLVNDIEKILNPEEARKSMYYFNLLRIDLNSLKLSIFTSANLPESLQRLKSYLSLKIIGFEDAHVDLSPYLKMNVSKTFKSVFESVTRFYKSQIMEQAPRIVGQQIQNYLRFHLSDLLSTIYDEVYKVFN